jgi:integrase
VRKTKLRLSQTKIKGQIFHVVFYPGMDGKRKKRHFKARSDAREFHDQKRVELANFGTAAAAMDERDRAEYLECRDILEPYGISLREAVKKVLPQLKAENSTTLVSTAKDDFLAAKKMDGMSPRYLKDLKSRLELFSKNYADHNLAEITTAEIDDWLRRLPGKAVTRNNFRRILGVFFSYAEKRELILKNPVINASKAKEIPGKVGVLTPDQASKLLKKATKEILPAIAIGLFAGLRPESEIWRLDWQHIDFEQGLIRVDAENSKIAANRFVAIPDILRKWLLPHKKENGPVSPKGDKYYSLLEKARKEANITKWPQDALRHSYGSYHYAKFQDIAKVMAEMGHSNPRTFLKHYRERVKPADADAYWQISPLGTKTDSTKNPEKSPLPLKKRPKRV